MQENQKLIEKVEKKKIPMLDEGLGSSYGYYSEDDRNRLVEFHQELFRLTNRHKQQKGSRNVI